MIFAAVFEKWEKSLLIAADNAGLDSLIELLKKNNEAEIHSLKAFLPMGSINLKIKTKQRKNIIHISSTDSHISFSRKSSEDFIKHLLLVRYHRGACHHFFDVNWDYSFASMPILISKDEYL